MKSAILTSRRILLHRRLQGFAAFALLLARVCTAQVNATDVSPDFPFGAANINMDGRIPGMVLDPSNNSIVYAVGEFTGVWKSVDGAHTWLQSSHGLRNGITQEYAYPNLAIDASNSQRLLYATDSVDGRVSPCQGCLFGGLWTSVDGAASWQHSNLCSVNQQADNIASVVFSSGSPFVATDCGIWTTTDPLLQTGWSKLTLPSGGSAGGTISAPSSFGQALFACLGDGTRVYRSLNLGKTWDAGVDVGGRCTGLAVAYLPGEPQPSTSVVIHGTPGPVSQSGAGSNALEVTVVNQDLATAQNLGFASVAVGGSGRSGVWTVRRTPPPGGATGPAVSYDVFAADNLNFYRYSGNNQWSGSFPVHVDSWWMEFPNSYDSAAGNCPAYAAHDGGVVANATNSCLFNGWVGASSGLHVAWSNHISGISGPSSTIPGSNAQLCAVRQGGHPCPLLFLPTTDDDVFVRETVPNCLVSNPLGGCVLYGDPTYSWTTFPDGLGDAGEVLIDPAQSNLALACRNGNYNMFVAPSGQLPAAGMNYFPTIAQGTNYSIEIQAPTSEGIKQVLTMPNETPLANGDFLAVQSSFSTDFLQCVENRNCGNDIIVRNTSASLGQQVAENSWNDISPQAQFGPGQVTGIYPSGGHNTTVYVLTSNDTSVHYEGTPYLPGQAYKAQSQVNGGAITSWQPASGSGSTSLTRAYNLFVNPYDPSELWAIDLGASPSAIKVSRDGGQSWAAVQQLKDIDTNYGEFDFTCGAFANGPNTSYADKQIFGNQCSMTEMLFPPGLPQVRFAMLYPGGVAFSGDSGKDWIPLNATNALPSQQPIELPQSAFYDPNVNAAGNSSLYVALEGKGVKRIDAPFATLASMPSCTSVLSCSGITFGFPALVVQCTSVFNFYQFATTTNQTLVGSGMSYTSSTLDLPNALAACPGQANPRGPSGGSCAYFSTFEPSHTYCGAPPPQPANFCPECKKTGGICTTLADRTKVCIHE